MTEGIKMISEMQVNSSQKVTLLLKDFAIRQTKALKDYLWAIFTDGVEDIQAQDWDWQSNPSLLSGQKLEKGMVYDIAGQVTEYNGSKQMKLVRMEKSEVEPLVFAPQGGVDVEHYKTRLNYQLDMLKGANRYLYEIVYCIINDNYKLFTAIPAAMGMHHAYVHGLLKHSVDVTEKAVFIANTSPGADMALVRAGALIHDIGKVRTYELNGALIEMTEEGQFVEHIMLGAMMLDKYRTKENSKVVDLLLHIISSHHGKREYGSPTPPRMLEAMIVSAADGIDASTATVMEVINRTPSNSEWTEKIWSQNNLPFMTTDAVQLRLKG